MLEALAQVIWRAAAAVLLVVPLAVMLRNTRERVMVAAAVMVAMSVGFGLWWVPGLDSVILNPVVLQGNTLIASLFVLGALLFGTVGFVERAGRFEAVRWVGITLLVVPLMTLDGIELAGQVRQIAFLKDSGMVYLGVLVVPVVLAVCVPVAGLLARIGAQRYVAPWSLLVFSAAVRAGFEPFLITAVEGAVARVMHDAMHLLIVLILFPDHNYLAGFVWTLVGLTFQKSTATILNLVVFLGANGYLIARAYYAPLPVHHGLRAADRRGKWAQERAVRKRVSAPAYLAFAIFAILAVRLATYRAAPAPPEREPLVTQKVGAKTMGIIDTATLEDTRLHVWEYESGGKAMRVMAILKPDGENAVCLDACLVCAPDGYAEFGEDVFCLYCGTPIPISTVGEPGGCNPVPLADTVETGGKITFDANAALAQWQEVTGGK